MAYQDHRTEQPWVVAGAWCCELNADRYVLERQSIGGSLTAALNHAEPRASLLWLRHRISHPPIFLRRWMAQRPHSFPRVFILLTLFPFACLVRFMLLLIWGVANYLGASLEISLLPEQIIYWLLLIRQISARSSVHCQRHCLCGMAGRY